MGLMQKLSRKLSGTRAESGVRSNNAPRTSTSTTSGNQDALQMMPRQPVPNQAHNYPSIDNGRPQYTTQPSHTSSNISVPSQLCDVVVHCATVLPRTNTNTSSIHSGDMHQNGFDVNFDGRADRNFDGFNQRNGQRDTIMPLHTDNDSYRAGYEAGRLYKPQSVPSSLHSSRPGTGGYRGDTFHTPPCISNGRMGQDSRWESSSSSNNNNYRSNSSMNLGHSHAAAFHQPQTSWSQSGPSTDSSQISQGRNTMRMESGAYDAGYRDAVAEIQRNLR